MSPRRAGAVFVISLTDAPVGEGTASPCDVAAQDWGPGYLTAKIAAAKPWGAAPSAEPEPTVRSLHGIEAKVPDYIWPGRIARGETTMMSGDPGAAKTFTALGLGAELTRGRVPVTGERCKPLRILYCTTENSPEHVIAPRFRAMGGDDRNLFLLESAWTLADVTPLEQAIVKYKIDLVFIDPLQSYFGEGADSHKATEVRPRMDALMRLAARHNVAIVIIRHLAKAASGRAIHRGMGSIDFSAAVRIELMVGHRADNSNDRAIITVKNNLGEYAPALGFTIEGSGLNAKLKWTGETDMKLADLTAPESTGKEAKTKTAQCIGYLRAKLSNGPVKQSNLVAEGDYDVQTLQRAAKRIGVTRTGSKRESDVTWELPEKKFGRKHAPETEEK
jgi:hypothetical protein